MERGLVFLFLERTRHDFEVPKIIIILVKNPTSLKERNLRVGILLQKWNSATISLIGPPNGFLD